MIANIIFIVVISALFVSLVAQTIFYAKKYKRLIKNIAELLIEKEALANKLDRLALESSKEVNDGFIKFLSESREAAFDYIDGVQNAISSYLKVAESDDKDAITVARMELSSYLPDESSDRI